MQGGRLVLQGVRRRPTGRLDPTLALGRVTLGLGGRAGRLIAGLGQSLGRVLQCRLLKNGGHDLAGVDPLVGQVLDVLAAERAADALQSLRELAGDDPQLVGVTTGKLREYLEVLVGEELLVRLPAVNGLEHLGDRAGLPLSLQDAGLGRTLSAKDLALLVALGSQDGRLLDTLCREDGCTAVTLCAHLLLHRVLHRVRRVDGLELDAVDPDAPLARGLVENAAQLRVDLVAAGQGLLEIEGADDVTQRGDRELLDALDEVGDLVHRRLGVDDRVVDDCVDVDHEVVGRDHRLRREGHDLLAQVDVGPHLVDERHEEVQAALEGS